MCNMNLLENKMYQEDISYVCSLDLPWQQLENKSIMISGATGMFGRFLIDTIMKKDIHCHIYALGRNKEKAQDKFRSYWDSPDFDFVQCDINQPIEVSYDVDYVFHAASNTHPVAYATDPIGTITANVMGTYNLLEYASNHNCQRFVLASSNEIYGENRGDVELFDESYCGYIDSNTLRAGYPESKRCAEALCQAYKKQKGLDVVIARFTRSYGPSLLKTDTKALSQFIRNGLNKEDIVLKSEGTQYYSYTYVADAISGLLTILLKGESGQAYNIADIQSDIMLKDLAQIIASEAGTAVVFDLPDATEAAGFSKATKARLDSTKLQQLGWHAHYTIEEGMHRTLEVLREIG